MKKYVVLDRYFLDEIELEVAYSDSYFDEEEAIKICKVSDCYLYDDKLLIKHPVLGNLDVKNDDVARYSFEVDEKNQKLIGVCQLTEEQREEIHENRDFEFYPFAMVPLNWDIKMAFIVLRKRYPHKENFELSFVAHIIGAVE